MSLLNRLASLTPAVPPGAALAGTVTIVSAEETQSRNSTDSSSPHR